MWIYVVAKLEIYGYFLKSALFCPVIGPVKILSHKTITLQCSSASLECKYNPLLSSHEEEIYQLFIHPHSVWQILADIPDAHSSAAVR